MNKFEHVSSDAHQMSLVGGKSEGSQCPKLRDIARGGRGSKCHVSRGYCRGGSNASWVVVTWESPFGQND